MRTIIAMCVLILAAGAFAGWRAIRMPDRYGAFTGAPLVEPGTVMEHPDKFSGKTISVRGTVRQQCKSMGCYFFIPAGTKTLRIDLQSIAMTAPMREGHRAIVEGRLERYGEGFQIFASGVEFK